MLGSTETLRRGFELLSEFEQLFCDQPAYEMIECEEHFAVRSVGLVHPSASAMRFCSEIMMAGFLHMVRSFCAGAEPRRVTFEYPEPPHGSDYTAVFGTTVQFEQTFTELAFDRELLDVISPHSDHAVQAAVRSVAERQLSRQRRRAPYAVRVRHLLLSRMPERLRMPVAAALLGVSERSLRRELAGEGTSLREVVYAGMAEHARALLQDRGRTIQQTAYEMGFSDATTFHRAFKRWTGKTPSDVRDL